MYKEVNVVMLPTKGKSKLRLMRGYDGNALGYDLLMTPAQLHNNKNSTISYFHLFITSDEEIKEGDWFINEHGQFSICSKHLENWLKNNQSSLKKIIATTDTSLNLPQIPQQFIEKYIEEYNKGNVIDKVEVEYNLIEEPGNTPNDRKYDELILKVSPDNTINIKPIKDNWSREEVIKILDKFAYDVAGNGMLITSQLKANEFWIEKNL